MEKYILQAPNCWHQFAGRMAAGGDRRRLGIEGSVAEGHGHQRNVSLGSTVGYGGNGGHSRGDSLTQRSMLEGMENMGDEIARAEARKIK